MFRVDLGRESRSIAETLYLEKGAAGRLVFKLHTFKPLLQGGKLLGFTLGHIAPGRDMGCDRVGQAINSNTFVQRGPQQRLSPNGAVIAS